LPDESACDPLAALLREAGLTVERTDDVEALTWGKAVVSAAINPLAALLRLPNGALLDRDGAWQVAAEAARETAAVARALGLRLPFPDPVERAAEVARATAANRASMLQDIERGRPTEIDAICGVIAAEGARLGVATPVNRTLWNLVRSLGPRSGDAE
jgi:2-dehydropantoate 2-reductase